MTRSLSTILTCTVLTLAALSQNAVAQTAMANSRPVAVKSSAKSKPAQRQNNNPLLAAKSKVIDLTYNFDEQTIYWPTAQPFKWEKEAWGESAGGYWYTAARYAASEHGGTHLDSPIHFGKGKNTIDEIPLSQLIGAAVVIDIAPRCAQNPDYVMRVSDVTDWEKKHGAVPEGAIVLVHTGWGKYWPNKKQYLGSDTPGDTTHLHFPGISREAANYLTTQKRISGIGIDTASIDCGQSKDFIAHQIFNGANIYGLENVANLERLPAVGATLIVLPMKIKGGTGGPVRIIAVLP